MSTAAEVRPFDACGPLFRALGAAGVQQLQLFPRGFHLRFGVRHTLVP